MTSGNDRINFASHGEAFRFEVELHLRELRQAESVFRRRWLPGFVTVIGGCLYFAWLQSVPLFLELAVIAVFVGMTGWTPVRAARATLLEVIYRVSDPLVIGAMAEIRLNDRRDIREAAGTMVLKLLPRTDSNQGTSLLPEGVEALVHILKRGANADQLVPALAMLSHRTEQCSLDLARWLAASPGGWWDLILSPNEEGRIQSAAVAARDAIEANRERLRQQETLLRPSEEGAELALLRAATVVDVPEEQLLRPGALSEG
jgi:hypothetical protein